MDEVAVQRWAPAVLVGVATVAAVVVAVVGVAVAGVSGDTGVDRLVGTPIIELAAGHRTAVVGLADLGGPETIGVLAVALAVILLARGRRVEALLAVVAPAVAGGLTQLVLKPLVDRPLGGQPAYPSGHATGTWALATVVVLVVASADLPRRVRLVDGAVVATVAVVNSVALVGAQYHFVTDVIGGAAVGVGVAAAGAAVTSWAIGRPARR